MLVGSLLLADEVMNDVVINADRFDYKDNIAYAYGDIYMRYKDNVFFANKATYDKEKNIITLEGNVQVASSRGFKIVADKVIFEADDKHILFSDFYGINQDDIWIYAKKVKVQKIV